MGMMQRKLEEREDNVRVATALCVELGVLEECERHSDTYFEGNKSLEEGFRKAGQRWSKGETYGFKSLRAMTDAMQTAFDTCVSEECPSCRKWLED
jgi:hypothetical protein